MQIEREPEQTKKKSKQNLYTSYEKSTIWEIRSKFQI
jgi:hypothetical protein